MRQLINWLPVEDGQGLTEYVLILGAFALALVGVVALLIPEIASMFSDVTVRFN